MEVPLRAQRLRFGAYEIDLRSGELHKYGLRIKLQDQPFQILALLLERPGELVTREDLRQKLWAADTFVDFDVGLNSAVKRLRDALGDTAEKPRYIETLHRRGYRFIASVEDGIPQAVSGPPANDIGPRLVRSTVLHVESPDNKQSTATMPPRRSRLLWSVICCSAAVLLLVSAALRYRMANRLGSPPYTIAVVPFRNLSAEPDSDYFSDGLTSEIIRNLSIIDGLEVRSQTSSFSFKNKSAKVRDVGAQLGVKLVLEGSVRRSRDKLRISTQLVRVSDDVPIWSGNFDRQLQDVFVIQDEISRSIVNQLRLNLGAGQRRYNMDAETYDLYLKADTLATLHSDQLQNSVELFESAIARDPDFAPAYAGLAIARADLSISSREHSPDVAYPKMRPAAEKALQLDPLLPEAYDAMGLVYARDQRWQQAESALRRSLQLNSGLARTHTDFALWVLFPMGKLDEAARELRIALRLDPLSMAVRSGLSWVLLSDRNYDEVIKSCADLPWDPGDRQVMHMHQVCGRALVQKGRLNEAIAIFERWKYSGAFLGYAYAKIGRRNEAEQLASKYADWVPQAALIYAGLGEKDRALALLAQAADEHRPILGMYLTYPEFDSLRDDPRFNQVRAKIMQPVSR